MPLVGSGRIAMAGVGTLAINGGQIVGSDPIEMIGVGTMGANAGLLTPSGVITMAGVGTLFVTPYRGPTEAVPMVGVGTLTVVPSVTSEEDDIRANRNLDLKGPMDVRFLEALTWQYITPTPKGLEVLEDGAIIALVDALPAGIGDAVVSVHEPTVGGPGFSPDAGGTLLSGLQAYFKLDESSGDVTDSIAGLVGTNSGSSSVAGVQGNARSFGGTDYIQVPQSTRLDLTGEWSWAGWIYPTNVSSIQTIMTKGTSTGSSGHQWILYINANAGGDVTLTLANGEGANTPGGVLTQNAWNHIVVTLTGGATPAIWVNGVAQSVTETITGTGGGPITDSSYIGRHSAVTGRYFTGRVDELGLWNRKLTNAEIGDLYNAGTGNTYHASLSIAAGIGAGVLLRTYNDAVALTDVVRYGGLLTDPGAGTEDSAAVIYARTAGGVLTEVARFSSGVASFVGAVTPGSIALTDGKVLIGNGSNLAEARTLSGDATIGNTGVLSLANTATARTNIGLGTASTPTFAGEALLGTRPTLRLNHNSDSQSVRLADYVGSAAYLTYGISYDGTDWQRDDTSAAATIFSFSGGSPLAVYAVPSGANPATAALSNILALTTGGQLALPIAGSGGGILAGGDVLWYRNAADVWRTPDSLIVDGTSTLAGAVTASASVKVGAAATTPATGDVVAAGKGIFEGDEIRGSNSGIKLEIKKITLTNNATARLPNVNGGAAGTNGFFFISSDNTNGGHAIYLLRGGFAAVSEVSDPLNLFSPTAGTATSTNVYWSAGNSRYEIENKTGFTQNYSIFMFTS